MNKIFLFILTYILLIIPVYSVENQLEYNYENTDSIVIPLKITKTITTSKINKSYEGEKLEFIVDKNVYYKNNLIIKRGEIVNARLEIIINRGFVGIPAEIFITDFNNHHLDSKKILEPVSIRGFSTTTLILPIKWALTPFPPFGSITNIFVGFNTKLTPNKILNLTYFPNY